MLSMAVASISGNLPIAYIHGGETSLGSFDENQGTALLNLAFIFRHKKCSQENTPNG